MSPGTALFGYPFWLRIDRHHSLLSPLRLRSDAVGRDACGSWSGSNLPGPAERAYRMSPTSLERRAFLMAAPFSYATTVANNPWMQDIPADERMPDVYRALRQCPDLDPFMSS